MAGCLINDLELPKMLWAAILHKANINDLHVSQGGEMPSRTKSKYKTYPSIDKLSIAACEHPMRKNYRELKLEIKALVGKIDIYAEVENGYPNHARRCRSEI